MLIIPKLGRLVYWLGHFEHANSGYIMPGKV